MSIFKLIKHKSKKRKYNVFNTDFSKNVLISYITQPFFKGKQIKHTNTAEALAMAEVFRELSFNVDVVEYLDSSSFNYKKYDIIIGFGDPLINSFYKRNKKITTIFYGTGMHSYYQNHASLSRAKQVYEKRGKWLLNSCRLVEKTWSVHTTLVDYMIAMGNSIVLDSYKKYFHRAIFNIPVTYYQIFNQEEILKEKDYKSACKHFLWFGADGLIHKGLDLVLEAFSVLPDLELHVCGPIENESEFKETYYHELFETKNIHTYGFINLNSDIYKELVRKCGFIIFPSCAEGEPSSVINTMYYGLIPIVTETAGINIKNFGFLIDDVTTDAVTRSIKIASEESNIELSRRSKNCAQDTKITHSLDTYRSVLKSALETILKECNI